MGITKKVVLFELDLDKLIQYSSFKLIQKPLSVFPDSRRDIAFIVSKEVAHAQIEQHVRKTAGDIFENIEIFDLYQGSPVPEGKVSLAYYIYYRSPERTLTDEEVNAMHDKIAKSLVEKFQIEFR